MSIETRKYKYTEDHIIDVARASEVKIENIVTGRRAGTDVAIFNALLTEKDPCHFAHPSGHDFLILQEDQIGTPATGKFPGDFDNHQAQQACNISCGKCLSDFTVLRC
jgi:hypothetical protein